MAVLQELLREVHRKSRGDTRDGAVLGIDVGWNPKKPTTGLCLVEWTNERISWNVCKVKYNEEDRRNKLNKLTDGGRLLAVGIDGPLTQNLGCTNQYRAAEALLSRGKFQRRGKPGPTNGGSGPRLHVEATLWARLIVESQYNVGRATYPFKIHQRAVVEAFPNAFLAVLYSDEDFREPQKVNRQWTDYLFPCVERQLQHLLEALLPRRKLQEPISTIREHEDIASFVCAVTALCVVFAQCIAVGDPKYGYIILPPLDFWGTSASSLGTDRWAEDTLSSNWRKLGNRRHRRYSFDDAKLYNNNQLWTP